MEKMDSYRRPHVVGQKLVVVAIIVVFILFKIDGREYIIFLFHTTFLSLLTTS